MGENDGVGVAVEEMRSQLLVLLEAGDTLDQKLSSTMTVAGPTIALASVLQISLSPAKSNVYWCLLLVAVALFLAITVLFLLGARPRQYPLAIAAEWDELDRELLGKDERNAMLTLLSGYVEQIPRAIELNREKARYIKSQCYLVCGNGDRFVVDSTSRYLSRVNFMEKEEPIKVPKIPDPTPRPNPPKPGEAIKGTGGSKKQQEAKGS